MNFGAVRRLPVLHCLFVRAGRARFDFDVNGRWWHILVGHTDEQADPHSTDLFLMTPGLRGYLQSSTLKKVKTNLFTGRPRQLLK